MAAAIQKSTRHSRRRPPMAEINVTPFVDVMLVLPCITAPIWSAPALTEGGLPAHQPLSSR